MIKNCVIIGISGASASGKSLFASTIVNNLSSLDIGINLKTCTRDQDHLPIEERVKVNYDHPSAFEHELLFEHIERLIKGQRVSAPTHDYVNHTRSKKLKVIDPCSVLIIEGILLLHDENLRKILDIGIYIDAPLDLCLARRIKRDIVESGRTAEGSISQYESRTRQMFLQYVEPSMVHADLIVPHSGKNNVAVSIIEGKIRNILSVRPISMT